MPESLAGGVLVVTDRPAVAKFVTGLGAGGVGARAVPFPPFPVLHVPASVKAVATLEALARGAPGAVGFVDLAPDPAADVCRALRHRWPELPLLGLLCCPRAVGPEELRTLAATGARSLVDLQVRPDGLVRLLRRVAQGEDVLQHRLPRRAVEPEEIRLDGPLGDPDAAGVTEPDRAAGTALPAGAAGALCLLPALTDDETRLAVLVAQGLTDRRIGGELVLSKSTVSHQVQRLCHRLGVRNKTALAVWAALHGMYHDAAA